MTFFILTPTRDITILLRFVKNTSNIFNVYFVLQVPPAELEGLLRTHPSIEEAAVVGVPNDRTGEAPLAFVVVNKDRPTVSGEEIQEFVAERVAPYKRITAGVVFMDQLPKSAAGKILRRFLKDEYMKNAQSK